MQRCVEAGETGLDGTREADQHLEMLAYSARSCRAPGHNHFWYIRAPRGANDQRKKCTARRPIARCLLGCRT